MAGTVIREQHAGLATVWIHHPGKFNAMSRAMWLQLRAVFTQIQADPSVRCVLVRGRDGHFCAGGDISEYASFRFEESGLRTFHEDEVWGGLSAMLACDVPIVAHIEGNCMGAGVEMASCCDMRLSSDAARFGAPIAKLGFPMAPREAALVMKAVGELTAREMLLSAAVLDAPVMHQRGFLNLVAPPLALGDAVQALCARITELAPHAARLNKQALRALAPVNPASVAPDLIAGAYRYAASEEHREGVMSFVEKRKPHFS